MTGEQKAWMDKHPEYRVVGPPPGGGFTYQRTAYLNPDGTIPAKDSSPEVGCFRVGVLVAPKP